MGLPDLVICALSFVGGVIIVIGYFFSSQQKLRQKMVMGLGATDAIQAFTIIVGSSYDLAGYKIPTDSPACNASAFFYQATVVCSAAWTFCVALVTFMTLVYPLSPFTVQLEYKHADLVIGALVALCGIVPAAFGAGFFTTYDSGGLCWYRPNSLQSKLMLFIPRAIALIVVVILYARLFVFFRRRDVGLLETTASEENASVAGPSHRASMSGMAAMIKGNVPWSRPSSALPSPSQINSQINSRQVGQDSSPAESPRSAYFPPSVTQPLVVSETTQLHPVFVSLDPKDGGDASDSHSLDEEYAGGDMNLRRPSAPQRLSTLADHQAFAARHSAQPSSAIPGDGNFKPRKRLSPRQLNRRTSVLMMLYPLAYLLLFSVAMARLIVQLSTTKPVHPALANISRWLVFSQGIFDCLIFLVCEYVFRRTTRNRM